MRRIILFSAGLLSTGCGDTCNLQITEYTRLTNLTGSRIKIELCKIPYKIQLGSTKEKVELRSRIADFEIENDQDGDYLVDSYTSSYSKDKNKACESGDDPSYTSQLFLTPSSQGLVKLCRDDGDPTKVTIVKKGAGCPTNSTSQIAAIANCDETALVD